MRVLPAVLLLGGALLPVASSARGEDAPPVAAPATPVRVAVPVEHVHVDDGDSVWIDGPEGREDVRLLGLDAPEVQHLQHDIPFDQPFGREASAFLRGCLAMAERVEVLRAEQRDPYGRTLGYVFANGRNLSVLAIEAGHAAESITRYGDNGLAAEAAACLAAAKRAGPPRFEDPQAFRRRMAKVAARMKADGTYPRTGE